MASLEQQISSYVGHIQEAGFQRFGKSESGNQVYYVLKDPKGRQLFVEVWGSTAPEVNRGYVTPIFDPRIREATAGEDRLFQALFQYILSTSGYELVRTSVITDKMDSRKIEGLAHLAIWRIGTQRLLKIGRDTMEEITTDIDYIRNVFMRISEFASQHHPLFERIYQKSPMRSVKPAPSDARTITFASGGGIGPDGFVL